MAGDDGAPDPLPDVLSRAWGLPSPAGKGPRPGLTLERIVAAAVGLAAAEGIRGVSMARVAAHLGVSTMGLYRYVASKDELLLLMVDHAWGPAPQGRPAGEDWRQGLTRWARTQRRVLNEHPWILSVPIGAPPSLPNEVGWMEDGLATMTGTGLSGHAKVSVILLVSGYVRNAVALRAGLAAAAADNETVRGIMSDYAGLLRRVTDPVRHPAVTEALAAGAFDDDSDDPDLEAEFAFGLERLLDGIEVMIGARAAARG